MSPSFSRRLKSRDLIVAIAVATAYFGFGRLGLLVATINSSASPVWPATGLAFATLHVLGLRFWPAIFVGALAANVPTDSPVLASFIIAIGNTLEAVVGAVIIGRIVARRSLLEHQTEVLAFGSASLIAAMVSATIGVTALMLTGVIGWTAASQSWITWWVGDVIGGLVFAPLIANTWGLSLGSERTAKSRRITADLLAVATIIASGIVLFHPSGRSFLFLLFPAILASRRAFGPYGTRLVATTICCFAIWMTVTGHGPFTGGTLNENLIHLQLFLGALALTSLVVVGFDEDAFNLAPVGVLVLGWILSGTLFYSFLTHEAERDEKHFSDLVVEIQASIRERMATYEEALLGGVALTQASEEVTLEEWKAYLSTVKTIERFPGVRGVGIIWIVPKEDVPKFEARQRAKGHPTFTVKPYPGRESVQNHRYVATFLEPGDRNAVVQGLDIATEPNRKAAAELARDTGLPTVTSKIELLQDDVKRPAFLLFRPIFDDDLPTETPEQRRRAIKGWVYAPFVTEGFFNGILNHRASQMDVYVFDGPSVEPERIIYRSKDDGDIPEFDRLTPVQLGQKPFTIGWKRAPGFISSHDTIASWVAFCGAVVTLLLTSLVVTLQSLGRRAKQIADQRTRELMASQRDLERASELASAASRAKSEFLANMSHEIRTPINGALGLTEILLKSDLTDDQRLLAENVRKSASSLLAIVNDVLDFSKIEAGKVDFEEIDFDLRELVEDLVTLVRFAAETKGIEVKLVSDLEPGVAYKGDPGRVKQVLLNLVNNAIKFTEKGGVEIRVHATKGAHGEDAVHFEVRDTGIGISEEAIGRLFREFSQADASTTRRYGGTGLGLSISKKLVEAMGGSIEVTSRVGEGSTFRFTIPLRRGEIDRRVKDPSKPSMSVQEAAKVRILLAEDNKVNQLVATKQLQSLGYSIDVVASGAEAVEAVKARSYDLVLMDCQMPVMDGFEATRLLREEPRFSKLPIIALTANAFASDRDQCLAAGMNDYLSKPVKVDELGAVISKWLVRPT